MPIREMTAGRDSASARSAAIADPALAPPLTARVPRPVTSIDWRQSSAPPAATSTSGQVTTSENGSPSSRNASSSATSRKPTPAATSSAARPWDAVLVLRGQEDPRQPVDRQADAAGERRGAEGDAQ
jgi:hypothetical protein